MDRGPNVVSSHRPGVLDDVLRRIVDEERHRHGAGLCFAPRVCMRYMVRIYFPSSNNVVKYEALVNGLRIAIELVIRRLDVQGDS